jgi:hypothetical protein
MFIFKIFLSILITFFIFFIIGGIIYFIEFEGLVMVFLFIIAVCFIYENLIK